MSGIDDVVDDVGIAAAVDVVEAAAEGEIVSEKVEAFFELEIDGQVGGEPLGVGRSDEFLLVVENVEWESGAGFQRVGDFQLMNHREGEEGQISPREEAVRSVPRIGARLLRGKDGAVDVEVESLIGVEAGAGVGAHQRVTFAEGVAEAELEGVVMVLARVLQEEVPLEVLLMVS